MSASLVLKQSYDIATRMAKNDIRVVEGEGRLLSPTRVATHDDEFEADAILLALGARPRILPDAQPDGERILTWTQACTTSRNSPSTSSWSAPA
ncbi:hypothetical protein GCM10025876_10350 [Demequina litorisediminis]|uniref:Uncharacterized protein n=1 Tax=Demequina litorisediminis TaxID=1849022 RepID=A0ABQ6IC39_9MICO|nr:hypothetical protein GCM10025876_10350 [Demequina litorisediminis]